MALIFMDGFDKYGPLNTAASAVPIFCKNGQHRFRLLAP
jgi:hypothetical protein